MGFLKLLASIGATMWVAGSDKAERKRASRNFDYKINTKNDLIAKYCDFGIEKRLAQYPLYADGSKMGEYPCQWFGMDSAPNPFIGEKIYNLLLEYRDKFPEFISGFYGGTDEYFSWYNLEDLRECFVEKCGLGVGLYRMDDTSWTTKRKRASILCMVMMLCGKIPSDEALALALTYTEMHEPSTYRGGRQYDRARFLLENPEIPSLIDPKEFFDELGQTNIIDKYAREVGCGGHGPMNQATCREFYLQVIELMERYDIHSIRDLTAICAKHIPTLESDGPKAKKDRRRELVVMVHEYEGALCITSYPCHPVIRASFAFMRLLADSDNSGSFAYFGKSRFNQSELSTNIAHFRFDLVYRNTMLIDIVERRMQTLHIKGGIDTLLDCIHHNNQQLVTAFMDIAEQKYNCFISNVRWRIHSGELPIYPDGAPLTVEEYEASR